MTLVGISVPDMLKIIYLVHLVLNCYFTSNFLQEVGHAIISQRKFSLQLIGLETTLSRYKIQDNDTFYVVSSN